MQVKTYASVSRLSNYFKPNILYKFKNSQIHVAKSLNNCREREDDFWQEIRTSMRYHFENLCCAIHYPPKIRCQAPKSQLTVPKNQVVRKSRCGKSSGRWVPAQLEVNQSPVLSAALARLTQRAGMARPSTSTDHGTFLWWVFHSLAHPLCRGELLWSLCVRSVWGTGASFPTRKEICERNFILVTKDSDRRKRNSPLKSEVISGYWDGGPENHPYALPRPWGHFRPIGKGGSLPYEVRQLATKFFMTSTFLLGMATLKAEKTSPRLFWLMLALKWK